MKDPLTKEDLVQIILAMAYDVIAVKDQLTELDSVIGDGDLGVTMTLGFNEVKNNLSDPKELNLQQVLKSAGMAFADKAASTFGTLVATMFMKAGDVVKEKDTIGPGEIAAMLRVAAENVQKRGKAKLGDKTVLDALFPAADAAEKAAAAGKNLNACLEAALAAAQQGAENTINMRAEAGRSSFFKDRTLGVKDPGAAAFVMMLESVVRSAQSAKG